MSQGWNVNNVAHNITFLEAVPGGAAVVVTEYAANTGGQGATDVWALAAWGVRWGYPREIEFFSDRLIFGRSVAQPQTAWMSQPADYPNFGKSTPQADSDAIIATLNARKQNAIQDFIALDKLITMTTGGAWRTDGGTNDVLTPASVSFKPQGYFGSSELAALIVGNEALYAVNKGYTIRGIAYSLEADGYISADLTIYSSHLVDGYVLKSWAYQQVPNSVVWMVRDDGVLLSMTYQREQQVIGWAQHQTDGLVEDVCCVPENGEDVLYLSVLRTIGGQPKRYIERMSTRKFNLMRDWFFVDSGLTYDGRNKGATTVSISGAGYSTIDHVTVTSSVPIFTPVTDIGDWIVLDYDNADPEQMTRLEIIAYVDSTHVTARPLKNVPLGFRAVATTNWAWARDTMSGLNHLEGKTVVALADAFVMRPVNPVTGGTIALDNPATIVHAGLAYLSRVETLDINVVGQPTVRGLGKAIPRVSVLVKDTRDIKAGPDSSNLDAYEARDTEGMQSSPSVINDLVKIYVRTDSSEHGRITIQHDDPLPISILSITPEAAFGGD